VTGMNEFGERERERDVMKEYRVGSRVVSTHPVVPRVFFLGRCYTGDTTRVVFGEVESNAS